MVSLSSLKRRFCNRLFPAFTALAGIWCLSKVLRSVSFIPFVPLLVTLPNKCYNQEPYKVNYKHLMVQVSCHTEVTHCPSWEWDVANWTLKYLDTQQNTSHSTGSTHLQNICYRPLHGERVLKIVHLNGEEEYRRCTATSTSCMYHPHYDKELKLRINSSPCCRKQLIELTKHVVSVFEAHNITYMLVKKALLGYVRNHGKLIPYDHDVDLIVDARDAAKVDRVVPELERPDLYSFEYLPYLGRTWFRVNFNTNPGSPGIDVLFFYIVGDNVLANYGNWGWVQTVTDVLPPVRGTFEGRQFWLPNKPVNVLDKTYGRDRWRKVLSCAKLDEDNNCVE